MKHDCVNCGCTFEYEPFTATLIGEKMFIDGGSGINVVFVSRKQPPEGEPGFQVQCPECSIVENPSE